MASAIVAGVGQGMDGHEHIDRYVSWFLLKFNASLLCLRPDDLNMGIEDGKWVLEDWGSP